MNPDRLFLGKTTFIFDFDGTIADTSPLHARAFQEALREYDLEFDYYDYAGTPTHEAMRRIFQDNNKEIGSELDSLVANKRQLANDLYKNSICFIPGAEDFISLLHKKGYKLYVASSGSKKNISTGLECLGLNKYFTGVITADDVVKGKPDPEIFYAALEMAAAKAEEAVVVEDSIAGLEAAIAANIEAICVEETALDLRKDKVSYLGFYELTRLLEEVDGK